MKTGLDKIFTLEVIQSIVNIEKNITNAIQDHSPDIVSIVVDEMAPSVKNLKLSVNNSIATKAYDELRLKLKDLKISTNKLSDRLNGSPKKEIKTESFEKRHSVSGGIKTGSSPYQLSPVRCEATSPMDGIKKELETRSNSQGSIKRKLQVRKDIVPSGNSWTCGECKITNFSSSCTMCGGGLKSTDDSTTSSESGKKGGLFRRSMGGKQHRKTKSPSSSSSVSFSEPEKYCKCPNCKEQIVGSECKNCESIAKQGDIWRCSNCAILNLKPTPTCHVCGHNRNKESIQSPDGKKNM